MIHDPPDSQAFRDESARTARSAILMLVAFAVVGSAIALFLMAMSGCGVLGISSADQAAVADYSLQRQDCIDQAKAVRGDAADDGAAYWTVYVPCANRVDARFGMDAGGLR